MITTACSHHNEPGVPAAPPASVLAEQQPNDTRIDARTTRRSRRFATTTQQCRAIATTTSRGARCAPHLIASQGQCPSVVQRRTTLHRRICTTTHVATATARQQDASTPVGHHPRRRMSTTKASALPTGTRWRHCRRSGAIGHPISIAPTPRESRDSLGSLKLLAELKAGETPALRAFFERSVDNCIICNIEP